MDGRRGITRTLRLEAGSKTIHERGRVVTHSEPLAERASEWMKATRSPRVLRAADTDTTSFFSETLSMPPRGPPHLVEALRVVYSVGCMPM